MTIMDMDTLNHFNLRSVNVGIIHQKLEEILGQINDFNNLIFIFLDTALLGATKPNHDFGLTTATDTVVVSCDLSKRTDVKTILGGEGEKLKKLVKEIDLTIITLIHENFFLYDLENYVCKTYGTKVEKSFSLYGLIFFSGEPVKYETVSLILPQNKLKFNVERNILKKKKKSFKLKKLNEKTLNCYFKRQYFKFWNIIHPKK